MLVKIALAWRLVVDETLGVAGFERGSHKTMSKAKIMIVDDAPMMRVLIKKIIVSDPRLQLVAMAVDGQDALKKLTDSGPDLILLDLEMPNMDGLAFLRHARPITDAKIVVLSARVGGGDTWGAEASKLGADAVIAKPAGTVSFNLAHRVGDYLLGVITKLLDLK